MRRARPAAALPEPAAPDPLGPLRPWLARADVSDVLVNAPDQVWADTPAGLERLPVRFAGEAAVRQLAVRLAAGAGRRLDAAQPWVDAPLPGGLRLHAVLPPVARAGTTLSLRVLRPAGAELGELVGTDLLELLDAVVRARLSVVVTGATGSGKTTVLSALVGRVDPRERVVLCEDTAELVPRHPHVVGLLTRPPNVEGAGGVDLRDLVRQALRMRPDRLVLGEARGAELADLLVALTSGHRGGLLTLHADDPRTLPVRVAGLLRWAGLPAVDAAELLGAAVQVVVHLRPPRAGRRGVAHVAVLRPVPGRVEVVGVLDAAGSLGPAAEPAGATLLAGLLHAAGVAPPPWLRAAAASRPEVA
jgi:pilus assembly protein CpaF